MKERQDLDKLSSYKEREHSKLEQRHMAKIKLDSVWIEYICRAAVWNKGGKIF